MRFTGSRARGAAPWLIGNLGIDWTANSISNRGHAVTADCSALYPAVHLSGHNSFAGDPVSWSHVALEPDENFSGIVTA
jgi:hypothetical protein